MSGQKNGWNGVNCILAASDMSWGPWKNNHFSNQPMWVVKNLFITVVKYRFWAHFGWYTMSGQNKWVEWCELYPSSFSYV